MRRVLGVLVFAALAPSMAHATTLTQTASTYDLGPQVMMRVFGETNDSGASRMASYGDRFSESPLRDLAFTVSAPPPFATAIRFDGDVASLPSFIPAAQPSAPIASHAAAFSGRLVLPSEAHFVATAASLPPVASAEPLQSDDSPLAIAAAQPPASVAAAPAAAPAFDGGTAASGLRVSPHVGKMEFFSNTDDRPERQLGVSDDAYGALATFGVRAGQRNLDVDVNSSYEHLMRDDTTAYSSTPLTANWQIGGNSAPAVPNYADVSKLAVGANVAVPVTHTLTLNLNYNAQRLLGAYGLPGLTNLNAIDNSYGGNLTFAIPRWSSELSVSALQYHYQDNILPANTFSDTRANVNLTVKF